MAQTSYRQAAQAAVYAGGGAVLATAFLTGVLTGQAVIARRTIPLAEAPPPRADGRYGNGRSGNGRHANGRSGGPLTLAMLGDSTAAGYGVAKPRQTPGALLAAGLAARLRRPVRLRTFAVVGATSSMLRPQVSAAVEVRPDVAVILVGANDVTRRIPPAAAVRHLVAAVRRLRETGAVVVVGTCPDLGAIQPIPQPLRWFARRWSRQMAAAQTIAVLEAGGVTVSLGDLVGPMFAAAPEQMFAFDGFHPSFEGYGRAAAVLLPTLVTALNGQAETPLRQGEGVRSLGQAAVEASRAAGTEVTRARVAGREHGPAGRWVQLRRRVREVVSLPLSRRPDGRTVLEAEPENAVRSRVEDRTPVEKVA